MTVELYAGSFADFGDSMAAEIEQAMNDLLVMDGKAALSATSDDARDRRRLLIAIATGVIEHIRKKQEAFRISVDGTIQTVTPDIQVRNP